MKINSKITNLVKLMKLREKFNARTIVVGIQDNKLISIPNRLSGEMKTPQVSLAMADSLLKTATKGTIHILC